MNNKESLKSVLAGCAIGLGGAVCINSPSKIAGAILFSIGLFIVCAYNLNLFTGKICYTFQDKRSWQELFIIYFWNIIGASFIGCLTNVVGLYDSSAASMFSNKYMQSWLHELILGFLCNICIFIAVDGYKRHESCFAKIFSVVLGVVVFIVCGFEHSIANAFYIVAYGQISADSILTLIYITMGNILGGLLISYLQTLKINSKQ